MSADLPQKGLSVVLDRDIVFRTEQRLKIVESSAGPAVLKKGTKGVIQKIEGNEVTVVLDWTGNGKLKVTIPKLFYGQTFQPQTSKSSVEFKFSRDVIVDSQIKVLTPGIRITSIPRGTRGKVEKLVGAKALVSILVPNIRSAVQLEMTTIYLAKLT